MKTNETYIADGLRTIKRSYYIFWLVVVIAVSIGEMSSTLSGIFAQEEVIKYIAEISTILVAGLSIPISLKLVASKINRITRTDSIEDAIRIYLRWSRVRVGLLSFAVVVAIATHYLCVSSAGALCAVIVCAAALLCIPSRKKMEYVLAPILGEESESKSEEEEK